MPEESLIASRSKAWLVLRSGPQAGTRYPLQDGVTRIGRDPENEIVVQGPDAAVVSSRHAEIFKDDAGFRIRDLGSTNGTYVDGERIAEAELHFQSVVQLGKSGQEFALVVTDAVPSELDTTLVLPEGIHTEQMRPPAPVLGGHDALLNAAVTRARQARAEGAGGQTMTIMREALHHALRRSGRRLRILSAGLATCLVLLSAYGYWKTVQLRRDKARIDGRIQAIEKRLDAAADPAQMGPLLSELAAYQNQGASLSRNVLYRLSVHDPPGVREIRSLMGEFGAEVYSIPPEFAERVNHYIAQYQGPDRPLMEAALSRYKGRIDTMRKVLEQQQLPPDLAYIPLVESALVHTENSATGTVGPWQFTPATARAFGLRVDGEVDQRNNLVLSTRAACRYLRDLILDFGAGSSVMLALAAYDLGPAKVKQAIARTVRNPIQQRNFWYLYHARALPPETREYVPKVFAAIIIGRNPEKFGF